MEKILCGCKECEALPTAEEFVEKNQYDIQSYDEGGYLGIDTKVFAEKLIEFTKLHVEAALKKAGDATLLYDFKEEIINSYPLDNIK